MSWIKSFNAALFGLAALSSIASAAHYDVTVGKGGQLKFEPEALTAHPGDTVTYRFFARNHAVAQSTFDNPCQLQEHGIFSGFTPTDSPDVAAPTTFTITVNDTKPLWFYCPQVNGNHCQSGMVHSINAPYSGNTFDAYKAKAQQAATPSTPPVGTLPVGGLRKLRIDVGFNGDLVFNPNNITELVGTVLEFNYNPANHSIVQSSFDKPCQPLESADGGRGFAAPFFATQQAPSGVTFEVAVADDKPIWFYCAQTARTHCQAGMVGAVNAPAEGDRTFDAYRRLAAQAPPSAIPPHTPLAGTLKVNGTVVADAGGAVLDAGDAALDPSLGGAAPPPPGTDYPPYIGGMAGGNQPARYGWGPTLSDDAAAILRDLHRLSDALVLHLLEGYVRLSTGQGRWAGAYPSSLTRTLGSLAAQSLIHRRTYADALRHYERPAVGACKYRISERDDDGVDSWLDDVLRLLALSVGAKLDAVGTLAAVHGSANESATAAWLVPALASELGAQTRVAAVLNLMQGHVAAAAPREVLIPHELALAYVVDKYVVPGSCESAAGDDTKSLPAIVIKERKVAPGTGGRLLGVVVERPADNKDDNLWAAWIGQWGGADGVAYTPVAADGTAAVPAGLSGHVWLVLTTAKDIPIGDVADKAVAGPEMVWVAQQWVI
ncbi:hypothetical protein GGS23DRAFT_615235 [Durotheca rogersii]|uniref:uncharacterized protein n=1 Tax=Durotheca rogersii TaxID=419775 RepID=UPI00221EE2A7|nr:uncharacterized protein GGS23DRAFT_615235 [Durotheca rogersii]KAI5866681.1 hypothetical protein GGS23DRAFT_615235 [Durotheca rogersii]